MATTTTAVTAVVEPPSLAVVGENGGAGAPGAGAGAGLGLHTNATQYAIIKSR